jgi:hypothetical protein
MAFVFSSLLTQKTTRGATATLFLSFILFLAFETKKTSCVLCSGMRFCGNCEYFLQTASALLVLLRNLLLL